jgi:preprotein translocase subunit SecD
VGVRVPSSAPFNSYRFKNFQTFKKERSMTLTSRPTLLVSMIIWLIVTVFGVYLLFNVEKYINFGIDLVGGTYITLEVDFDKAIQNELEEKAQSITRKLQEEEKATPVSSKVSQDILVIKFETDIAAKEAYDIAASEQDNRLVIKQNGSDILISLTAQAIRTIKQEAIDGNIHVLRTRLDAFGVGEINIAAQGEKYIVIELPNVDDPEKAKARIGKTALLELKPVYDSAQTQEALISRQGGQIPEGTQIVPAGANDRDTDRFYLVPNYAEVTGRLLKDANYMLRREEMFFKGSPHSVTFSLKPEGVDKFHDLTSRNVGGRIAIILDGVVVSAPGVNEPIPSGSGSITGSFEKAEAQELASLLKSGAFVAPVKYAEERHIGPSLGKESIRKGLLSCAIGLGLLLAFSVIVYKIAGIFAFVVLLYNLLLILFGLAWLGATLTLPGIAGMILTIGMAIDASILIYERIKEELAVGSTARKAVEIGFSGATSVILDANITHFIVSMVLYWLGTGPIQGFAVTMIIGILSTLITGLLLLKTIFNFMFDIVGIHKIKI